MTEIEDSVISQAAVEKLQDSEAELAQLLSRRLSINPGTGRAIFLSHEGVLSEASFVPVCSFGVRSKTLKWAWASEGMTLPSAYSETMFQSLAKKTDIDVFLSPDPMRLSEQEIRCLLALLVDHVDALGLISEECEDSIFYLLITNLEKILDSTAISDNDLQMCLYNLLLNDDVELFNNLRARRPELILDFTNADLRGDEQPWMGDLHVQMLSDLGYIDERHPRILDGINLSHCRLDSANLSGASMKNASLKSSVLVDTDLSRADLTNADLEKAFLNGTNFSGADLAGTNFAQAEFGRTLFVDTDLSSTVGLEEAIHSTASEISFSTLVKSGFKLSERFMRSAGVSIGLIDDLRRGQRFATTYSTCFLSYSTKDADFAQHLYNALIEAGVRVYMDRTELIAGEYLDTQLTKAIREHDRTIAILSENSLQSVWLEQEMKIALHYKSGGFTPIRLCDISLIRSFVAEKEIKPDIVDLYPILDFSGWQEKPEFARCRDMLLKSIRR